MLVIMFASSMMQRSNRRPGRISREDVLMWNERIRANTPFEETGVNEDKKRVGVGGGQGVDV